MATWYVSGGNADGSNSGTTGHGGTSWADAKDTLAHVNSVASAGDLVFCQGVFRETIPISKQLFWVGVGYCEFNGNGGAGVVPASNSSFSNIYFCNWLDAAFVSGSVNGLNLTDCIFRDMPNGILNSAGSYQNIKATRCVFFNLPGVGITQWAFADSWIIQNCAFFKNGIDIKFQNPCNFKIYSCIFGSAVMLRLASPASTFYSGDFNCFDLTNGVLQNPSNVGTLSAWTTAIGSETNSVNRGSNLRTDVGDYANNCFRPTPASFLLTAGPGGTPIGLTKPALTISNSTNASLFTGGVFTNTEIDAYGKLVLSAGQTSGTWASDVIDQGAALNVAAIEIGTVGTDATHYIDTDTSDSPGKINCEIRGQNSPFSKSLSEVTLPYNIVQTSGEVGAQVSPNAWRYVQVRLTLHGP